MTTATRTRPASDKQVAFLTRLLGERNTTGTRYEGHTTAPEGLSSFAISSAIADLLALPYAAERPQAEPGYYIAADDTMYVVVQNRAKTRTYAKVLVNTPKIDGSDHWTWEYAPGMGAMLAGWGVLTVEEAAKFGHLHGICFKCLKPLTDPKSVAAGMGPVCRKALAA